MGRELAASWEEAHSTWCCPLRAEMSVEARVPGEASRTAVHGEHNGRCSGFVPGEGLTVWTLGVSLPPSGGWILWSITFSARSFIQEVPSPPGPCFVSGRLASSIETPEVPPTESV